MCARPNPAIQARLHVPLFSRPSTAPPPTPPVDFTAYLKHISTLVAKPPEDCDRRAAIPLWSLRPSPGMKLSHSTPPIYCVVLSSSPSTQLTLEATAATSRPFLVGLLLNLPQRGRPGFPRGRASRASSGRSWLRRFYSRSSVPKIPLNDPGLDAACTFWRAQRRRRGSRTGLPWHQVTRHP